jgi:hypothetical protein
VFRLNLQFHQAFFDACGNGPLTEAISQFAFKAHAIQSYTIRNPTLLARVCKEHAQLVKLTRGTDPQALMELVAKHKQPAKMAYLEVSRRIEGHVERWEALSRAAQQMRPAAREQLAVAHTSFVDGVVGFPMHQFRLAADEDDGAGSD